MSLDSALQKASTEVPECVAAGYVDIATGMLLGIKTVDSHPSEVLDLLAAASAELFQGSNVVAIEQIFKKARGLKSDDHYFQQMVVFSDNLLHVFMRSKEYPDHVACFVCRGSVNMGMALTKSRLSMPKLEAEI